MLTKTYGPQIFGLEFGQADCGAVPVGNAFELGCAMQSAVERVGPAVIRALDHGARALAGAQFGPAMAAHVGEGAQYAVGSARHQHGFAGDVAGEPAAGLRRPCGESGRLPGAREDAAAFGLEHRGIGVPTGGNRGARARSG